MAYLTNRNNLGRSKPKVELDHPISNRIDSIGLTYLFLTYN